jgi:hypothetical protein
VHVTNENDPVPTVPPRFLGFQHPSGEVHINTNGLVVSCPGQENEVCYWWRFEFGVSLLILLVAELFGW